MTNLTEQEVCIGSLGQQKVYLYWSDVKDICTNAVSEAYEQARKENTKLKELLKGAREVLKMVDTYSGDYDSINGFLIVEEINQVLDNNKIQANTVACNKIQENKYMGC